MEDMTNPNHYYHHQQQEDATRATSSPIVVKTTTSPLQSTAPNSASSSPLSFNDINSDINSNINSDNNSDNNSYSYNNNNMMTTNSHANHDASDGLPATHQHPQPNMEHRYYNSSGDNNNNNNNTNHNDTFARGPLSPQSAPPGPGCWSSTATSTTPVPSVIHTEGVDGEGTMTMARATTYGSTPYFPSIDRSSSGNMSMGSVSSSNNLVAKKTTTSKVTGKKKHQTSKQKPANANIPLAQTNDSGGGTGTGRGIPVAKTGHKKQRRLERNRLSAQLSRRRRKQYLEELEERVVQLSLEMDSGRRVHAFQAMERISEMRQQVLVSAEAVVRDIESSSGNCNSHTNNDNKIMLLEFQLDNSLRLLENTGSLSRSNSEELLVLNSFLSQQLKSFSLPSHAKFILWLTLQGDIYYRGGRAASERLSAARIGERMLANGNDRVTPTNAMWPLVCNEVGLSYELEERLRNYQRTTILQEKDTWLDRHTARSSALVMQSFHDSVGGTAQMVGRRESKMTQGILTPSQRVKYLAWANKNSTRIKARLQARRQREDLQQRQQAVNIKAEEIDVNNVNIGKYVDSNYQLNQSQHLAANLYILNHQLQRLLKDFPYQSPSSLTPEILKKLMRRASFESLGQQKDAEGRALSREDSFASSGSMFSFASNSSLMNSASNLSLGLSAGTGPEDSERPATLNQITPQVGEQAAVDTVDQAIGFVKSIIPPIPKPMMSAMPVVHGSAPISNSMTGVAPTQDPAATTLSMDYHNHHLLVRAPVSSYGARAPLAPAPPSSNQHAAPMHHLPPPSPAQLKGHNYSAAPMPTHTSSQVQHAYQSYQQPSQPQPGQYYPPQQHIHYAPALTASAHNQPVTSIEPHQPIAPVYETPPSVIQQQQQQPPPAIKSRHIRKSSFLPSHLNAVPEDMFPDGEGTAADFFDVHDCLMDGEDDWGIGTGLDMDTTA